MKSKIFFQNFNFFIFKSLFLASIFFLSSGALAQIIVESVSPRRITTESLITVKGKSGANFKTSTEVSCSNIYSSGTKAVDATKTQLSFRISKKDTGEGKDVDLTDLKIDGKFVYVGSESEDNKVKLQYVAPKPYELNKESENRVREVYTNWNTFWKSSDFNSNDSKKNSWPNDRHDLLGFKMNYGGSDIIFSTGVNDELLESNLSSLGVNIADQTKYQNQNFKAYSTNGIVGKPHDQNYLAMADKIDGQENFRKLNDNVRRTVYDVIIDGANGHGLDLGTGITNFNQKAGISFFSGNGQVGSIDNIPDLLITQIAQPGGTDVYFYATLDGDVVGRPIALSIIDNVTTYPRLFDWRLDLFRMDLNTSYDSSFPVTESFGHNETRPYRIAAFKLQDFEIGNDSNEAHKYIGNINNINMVAGGSADISFIAYNRSAFDIKSPSIELFPVSRNVCDPDNNINVTFDTRATIDGGPATPKDEKETLKYKWFKNNSLIPNETAETFTASGVGTNYLEDYYRVRVYNDYGAVDLNFSLSKGGTPTYWNGTNWIYPSTFYDKEVLRFAIDEMDRSLIFAENYSLNKDLEGCDCRILAGNTVTIPSGKTLKLYNNIIIDPTIQAINGSKEIPAGTFTLENNASLIQIKDPTPEIKNEDIINAKKSAITQNRYDYVYWSSPVMDGKLSMIPGATSHVYKWQVDAVNAEKTLGNWVNEPTGNMEVGRGYIKRVNDPTTIKASFEGIPNNGNIEILVHKTGVVPSGKTMKSENMHLNLIGNPYPSSISAKTFLEKNTSLKGNVKIWKHNAPIIGNTTGSPFYEKFKYNYGDQYATFNLTGTVPSELAFDGNIISGQGFFVQVLEAATSPIVTFTNKMRYDINEVGYPNIGELRSNELSGNLGSVEKQLIYLSLVNEKNISSVTLIGYAEGATNGKDRLHDAETGSGDMNIYSILEDSHLIIQGRQLPFEEIDEVKLGVEIINPGIYTIGIDHLKGAQMLDEALPIFIEDTYNNTIHNLKTAPYSFSATAGNYKDRFVLRYTDRQLSVEDQDMANTFVYVKNERLFIKSSDNIEAVSVYDLSGKKLMDHRLGANSQEFSTNFQFAKGVYLTTIKLATGTITKKLIN